MNASQVHNEVLAVAEAEAGHVAAHFNEQFRPRVAEILNDMALVQIRKAQGQDVVVAESALLASLANITDHQKAVLLVSAGNVALTALSLVIRAVAGAV